jgi:hypothetical protein
MVRRNRIALVNLAKKASKTQKIDKNTKDAKFQLK